MLSGTSRGPAKYGVGSNHPGDEGCWTWRYEGLIVLRLAGQERVGVAKRAIKNYGSEKRNWTSERGLLTCPRILSSLWMSLTRFKFKALVYVVRRKPKPGSRRMTESKKMMAGFKSVKKVRKGPIHVKFKSRLRPRRRPLTSRTTCTGSFLAQQVRRRLHDNLLDDVPHQIRKRL